MNVRELEQRAMLTLPRGEFEYFATGACDMVTLRENRAAYNRICLRPRALRGARTIDTTLNAFGEGLSSPICIAPTAEHRAAHHDGELATVRGAGMGALMAVSSSATTSLEDVAAASSPDTTLWLQLSLSSRKNRAIIAQLVRRAAAAGYKALAVSGDRPVLGKREPDVRNRYELAPRLAHGRVISSTGARIGPLPDGTFDLGRQAEIVPMGESLNWTDLRWMRSLCGSMKIVIKGVMTAEDANEALACGADGVWVSNHGGRQLDTLPATIEALPEVVQAVDGKCPIFIDGGIRRGTDVLKALALGATAVFVGRPIIWGLAHNGEDGVRDVLKLLNSELVEAMTLAGCRRLADIQPSLYLLYAGHAENEFAPKRPSALI